MWHGGWCLWVLVVPWQVCGCRLEITTPRFGTETLVALPQTHDGAPVYGTDDRSRYLFFNAPGPGSTRGQWLLSDAVGTTYAWFYIDSFAANPLLIESASPKANWMQAGDKGYSRAAPGAVAVSCVDGARDETLFVHTDVFSGLSGFYSKTGKVSVDGGAVYIGRVWPVPVTGLGATGRANILFIRGRGGKDSLANGWEIATSVRAGDVLARTDNPDMRGPGWVVWDSAARDWGPVAGFAILVSSGRDGGVFRAMQAHRQRAFVTQRHASGRARSPTIRLRNGVMMPRLGFGTGALDPRTQRAVIVRALEAGFDLLDSATAYRNEDIIRDILSSKDSGRARDSVFLTTKLWPTDLGFHPTLTSAKQSLERLGSSYIDMYMLHWPYCYDHFEWMDCSDATGGTWEDSFAAMNWLYAQGRVLSLGVSNFDAELLERATEFGEGPHVVQNWLDILKEDESVTDACLRRGIVLQGYGILRGFNHEERYRMLRNGLHIEAKRLGKTPAQIILRHLLASSNLTSLLVRTANEKHMTEGLDAAVGGWALPRSASELMGWGQRPAGEQLDTTTVAEVKDGL